MAKHLPRCPFCNKRLVNEQGSTAVLQCITEDCPVRAYKLPKPIWKTINEWKQASEHSIPPPEAVKTSKKNAVQLATHPYEMLLDMAVECLNEYANTPNGRPAASTLLSMLSLDKAMMSDILSNGDDK